MTKLRITIDDERLSGRLRQRAENMGGVAVNGLVQALLMRALDQDDGLGESRAPEPPAPRLLDETTLRCLEAIKGIGARLEAAEPTYGLLSFGDESHAKDNAAVRTLSLSVMALPARSKL